MAAVKYGEFIYYDLRSLSSTVRLEVPFFQRILHRDKIDIIKSQLIKERDFLKSEDIIQTGIIHVGLISGIYYIMDGQHRLKAYQELNSPSRVMCQLWYFINDKEMREKFIEINSNTPLEDYILTQNMEHEKKLIYDKIVEYLETHYASFLKSTDKPVWPNINANHFRKLVDKIEDFNECTINNCIPIFENYNQKCKIILLNGGKVDKERLEKIDKKCQGQKILYINRDINNRWIALHS